uniref:N-acetyltransferase domain-containing protein n=1 Tax=Parastrongyloides trichosuri TaxID=131310 RepID=A0A0N5A3K2_PARTI
MSIPAVLPQYKASLIPEATSATVQNNGTVVASVSLIKISKNQGYVVINNIDSTLHNKLVTLKNPSTPVEIGTETSFELGEVVTNPIDKRSLRVYIQVHHHHPEQYLAEHLINQLEEAVLGSFNLELKKNVTIDLYDSGADRVFRDFAGFIVSERFFMEEINVDSGKVKTILKNVQEIKVEKTSEKDIEGIISYDETLSNFARGDFIKYLFKESKILHVKKNDEVQGYIVGNGEQILGIYAESQNIGEALLLKYISLFGVSNVIIKCKKDTWKSLDNAITKKRSIHRRHTRHCPSHLKWDKIFGANVGMNLF